MHRFFVAASLINSGRVSIVGDDVAHISRVLRLKCGDEISVCDQCGYDYICTLTDIGKTEVTAQVKEKILSCAESNLNITLYQGLPKGDKLELIIQKCCELGVKKIVPVVMKRTVVKVKNTSAKTERYQRIALEAAKQSGRGIVPEVCEPTDYKTALDNMSGALNILPYENEKSTTLKQILRSKPSCADINVIIGPEGGFDEEEIKLAENKNINIVTLGPRILRCETAPIAAVSAIMYELGDW